MYAFQSLIGILQTLLSKKSAIESINVSIPHRYSTNKNVRDNILIMNKVSIPHRYSTNLANLFAICFA